MRHLGPRYLLVPALALATLTACAGDPAGPVGPEVVPLASHLTPACAHDVVAPTITDLQASTNRLWPPNHKFVTVTLTFTAADDCTASSNLVLSASVSSNEPINGLGDGNTTPDWIVMSPYSVMLRKERSGLGSGRIYTITVTARDAAGNVATSTVTVTVPHDERKR